MSSGRLVAAMTKTLLRLSSPSISVSSWFTTRSLTPPPAGIRPPPGSERIELVEEHDAGRGRLGALEHPAHCALRLPDVLVEQLRPLDADKVGPRFVRDGLGEQRLPAARRSVEHDPRRQRDAKLSKRSGLEIGSRTDSVTSSRTGESAPTSAQVTSGMMAKPSRSADGCIRATAATKSSIVT